MQYVKIELSLSEMSKLLGPVGCFFRVLDECELRGCDEVTRCDNLDTRHNSLTHGGTFCLADYSYYDKIMFGMIFASCYV